MKLKNNTLSAILLFGLSIFINANITAQIETAPLKSSYIIKVKLKEPEDKKPVNKVIHSVQIIDSRDDTTSVGYCYSPVTLKSGRIVFENGIAEDLKNWITAYLGTGNDDLPGDQIFIWIKKLRVSNEATPIVLEDGRQAQAENGWEKGIVAKMELYLKRDSVFYPLYRYDSIMIMEKELPEKAGEYIAEVFKDALTKLYSLNFDMVAQKAKKLSLTDIIAFNKRNLNLPILNQSILKKGAYTSFEEFKNNNPSINEYQFKKGEIGDFLYVKENGVEHPDRTVWGFCDGKNIYINSADKFSLLVREGNTFYFNGIKSISKKAVHRMMYTSVFNLVTNTGQKKTVYKAKPRYYQVDMEDGEVY